MPRGGARVNSGPPPDPTALRRERPSDKDGWTALPAAGRRGRTPKWPLLPDVSQTVKADFARTELENLEAEYADRELDMSSDELRQLRREIQRATRELHTANAAIEQQEKVEKQLWRDAWKLPQAVMWERLSWTRDVAQYVRHKTLGEMGSIKDAQEARQWSDRLGLNPSAMLRLRWRVAVDEVKQKREARDAAPPAACPTDMRSRIAAVNADGER